MARSKSHKGRIITVDFEGVEAGARKVADGNYVAEITEVQETESKSSGEPMLSLKWKITSKKGAGALLYDNISLQPQALWRLKGLMEALGEEVPDSSMEIDLSDLEGKSVAIEVTNEIYEGKERPRITAYFPEEDFKETGASKKKDKDEDEEDEDEDEPLHNKSKSTKKSKVDSDDEEEDEDEDNEDDEEDEDEKSSKRKSSSSKFKVKQRVKFRDEDGKLVKGTITELDGDTAKVEDADGDEWEIDVSELQAA